VVAVSPVVSSRFWGNRLLESEAVLAAGLVLSAAVVRAPYIWAIPRFTDETDEVIRALAVARGQLVPVTNVDAYIGPLWNCILGLGFWLLGPSSELPRAVILAIGSATVGVTYLLARDLARAAELAHVERTIGALGSALLATSAVHVVVSSHIAWSHSLTPLFSTAGLWLLVRAVGSSGRSLALAGLAFGLAIHTHPSAVALLPGVLIWAASHGLVSASRRPACLALALFLLVNAPLVAFNVATGFQSLDEARQVEAAYSGGRPGSPERYVQNILALLASLPLLVGSAIGERRGAFTGLDQPIALGYALLSLLGLVVLARRRVGLPLWAVGSTVLALPLLGGKFEPLFNGRYFAPLLPAAFAALAVAVELVRQRLPTPSWQNRGGLAVAALALVPLLSLIGYYRAALRDGPNNYELYRAAALVRAAEPRQPVVFDASLSGTRLSTAREGVGVLEYLLILDGGLEVRRVPPAEMDTALRPARGQVAVLSPQTASRLSTSLRLLPLPGEEEERLRRRAGFGLWRVERLVSS